MGLGRSAKVYTSIYLTRVKLLLYKLDRLSLQF